MSRDGVSKDRGTPPEKNPAGADPLVNVVDGGDVFAAVGTAGMVNNAVRFTLVDKGCNCDR